jgi:HPt (histidine-containing phosphotransfer) domain-containing protein
MPDDEKLYDTKTLIQTHQADPEFVKHMISLFIKNIPEVNANLENACNENNWPKVYFYAHKLKASIDLFNLEKLKGLIRKVEQKAKSQTETDTLSKEINFISGYIKNCIAVMKKEFKPEDA